MCPLVYFLGKFTKGHRQNITDGESEIKLKASSKLPEPKMAQVHRRFQEGEFCVTS